MAGMTAAERRDHIMAKLRSERRATVAGLMNELGCSRRTLLYDLEALSATFPLVTVQGKNGGVMLADWYQPQRSSLGPEQIEVLKRFASSADTEDRMILNSILDQFSPTR